MSWVITEDHIDGGEAVGVCHGKADVIQILLDGGSPNEFKFRMRDGDGVLYYEGLSSLPDSFAPLDDFGTPAAGATRIEYFEKGAWALL